LPTVVAAAAQRRTAIADRSVDELKAAINAFLDQHNAAPQPLRWIKSADDILAAMERFCVLQDAFTMI
jgi:hypothetical protein